MKKLVALFIVCAMSLALFGCGKKDNGSGKVRDDDDLGNVVLYFPAVLEGSKVTCNLDKIVIN